MARRGDSTSVVLTFQEVMHKRGRLLLLHTVLGVRQQEVYQLRRPKYRTCVPRRNTSIWKDDLVLCPLLHSVFLGERKVVVFVSLDKTRTKIKLLRVLFVFV